ncbi:MAG: histidine kinase dimerization/phospho-acceptor domain-containing protein, partial [Caulobacteraceae bacterium]
MSAIFLNGQEASNRSRLIVSTVLRTQHVRYWLISSWGLLLAPIAGVSIALIWCLTTIVCAGWARSQLEKWITSRWGALPRYFPLFSMAFTGFWAAAPLIAWLSAHPFGKSAALMMLAVGYNLSFTQLGRTPKQALIVTSPYTLLCAGFAASLWGTQAFIPFLFGLTALYLQLFVGVIYVSATHKQLKEHEEEQARLIRQLEESRDRADAANRAKSAFLGVVSHELRTPMNGVLGAAQLLDSTELGPTQQEYVSIIRDSGGALLTLLNDILDLTKIEADRMALEAVELDLPSLIERTSRTWSARASEKDLT